MNNITQSLKDLRNRADVNSDKNKTFSQENTQANLKQKVQESSVTLGRTKEV